MPPPHRKPPDQTPARRLRQRIERRYRTTETPLSFGPLRLPFVRVADPDRVLDEVAEEEDRLERVSGVRSAGDQLHLPYWAELWDSAVGMGQWLAEGSGLLAEGSGFRVQGSGDADAARWRCTPVMNPEPRTLNPPSVLDLGCGMGLAGTVAAALGARVMFADLEAPALLFARLNALPWRRRVRTRRLDWRTDRLGERFDLILGADILYERKQWDFLEPFWRLHLAPGGAVLLGEPGRQSGDQFIDWITPRGWSLARHQEKVETRDAPIRLFELRLAEEEDD